MRWIKNSSGKEDSMLTFATISFFVVSLIVVLSCVKSFMSKNISFEFTTPDNTLILGYLGATFTSYVVRRNSRDKVNSLPTTEKKEENSDA